MILYVFTENNAVYKYILHQKNVLFNLLF